MYHDDVIKWKHFPRYWPFVRGIDRPPVNSPHKGQWRGTLMFSLLCTLNKRWSKQSWVWWFETPPCSLWRHCNDSFIHPCHHIEGHGLVIISHIKKWDVITYPCLNLRKKMKRETQKEAPMSQISWVPYLRYGIFCAKNPSVYRIRCTEYH